jgi:hypothetical protein
MTDIDVRTQPCLHCGKSGEVRMPAQAFRKWRDGALLQVAWPEGTPDQREQLISGTHPECWTALVGEEEE